MDRFGLYSIAELAICAIREGITTLDEQLAWAMLEGYRGRLCRERPYRLPWRQGARAGFCTRHPGSGLPHA